VPIGRAALLKCDRARGADGVTVAVSVTPEPKGEGSGKNQERSTAHALNDQLVLLPEFMQLLEQSIADALMLLLSFTSR